MEAHDEEVLGGARSGCEARCSANRQGHKDNYRYMAASQPTSFPRVLLSEPLSYSECTSEAFAVGQKEYHLLADDEDWVPPAKVDNPIVPTHGEEIAPFRYCLLRDGASNSLDRSTQRLNSRVQVGGRPWTAIRRISLDGSGQCRVHQEARAPNSFPH